MTTIDDHISEFAGRMISWRRLLALAGSQDARLKMYDRALREVAGFVEDGLDRTLAIDELLEMATAHNFFDEGEAAIQEHVAEVFARVKPNGHAKEAPPKEKTATRYVFPDPADIPRREWLYGGHYVRGAVTTTCAPGGFGKTTLTLFEVIDMAAQGTRVWYISGEDPRVEIDRRLAAHCQHHSKLDVAAIAQNLWLDDKESFELWFGTSTRSAFVKFDDASLKRFEDQIEANQIDVVALDPFISFHSVPENDNGAIDQIVKRLARIAQKRNCCIEISHHVRKPIAGQDELTVDDARGGGAIINAVRSARVINRMTTREAGVAKVAADKRSLHIRVDAGKRNMKPAEVALWWQIVSEELPNGDNVQSIERWPFPSAFEGMSSEERDWVVNLLREGGPRRTSSQSPDWLGHDLGLHCGRPMTEVGNIKWANAVIGAWIANKVFKQLHMRGPDRKLAPYYVHNEFVDPEQSADILPFEAPPVKRRSRLGVVDEKTGDNTICIACGKPGDVMRLKDNSQPGGNSETLHLKCAERWFDEFGKRKK